jgi:DNA-binding MarR family transcriptional regulator
MADKLSDDELESVAALRVAMRRFLAATDDVTGVHDLTPRQYDLLAILHRPNSATKPTASFIADELCLSRSATTELLTRASKAGLIVRDTDSNDMRIKQLSPTREGSRRFYAAVNDLRAERNKILTLLRAAAAIAALLTTSL